MGNSCINPDGSKSHITDGGEYFRQEQRVMPDGAYEVCAAIDGLRLCGFVSSAHLCDQKFNQLAAQLGRDLTDMEEAS